MAILPSYLEHVASRLSREEARVAHYLHGSSRKPLMAAVRQTLLAVHKATGVRLKDGSAELAAMAISLTPQANASLSTTLTFTTPVDGAVEQVLAADVRIPLRACRKGEARVTAATV